MERDVSGSSGMIPVIMAAAVALASLISLIPSRLSEFIRRGLQQLVERFLYAASYQLFALPLDNFLV